MFEAYNISQPQIVGFALVLIRMSAFIVTMPIFGAENVPQSIKVLTSLILALLVFPTLSLEKETLASLDTAFIWMSLREVCVGIILGFISRLFFFALIVSGEMISLSIGLSSEQLLNPATGGRTTAIQQFQVLLGTVFFLGISGHHYLIAGLVQSFEIVPLTVKSIQMLSAQQVGIICQEIVWVGIKLASPVMAAIFFMNIVLGVMGRAVPQINVLITSLPANVMAGFFVIIMTIPLLLMSMGGLAEMTAAKLFLVMKDM